MAQLLRNVLGTPCEEDLLRRRRQPALESIFRLKGQFHLVLGRQDAGVLAPRLPHARHEACRADAHRRGECSPLRLQPHLCAEAVGEFPAAAAGNGSCIQKGVAFDDHVADSEVEDPRAGFDDVWPRPVQHECGLDGHLRQRLLNPRCCVDGHRQRRLLIILGDGVLVPVLAGGQARPLTGHVDLGAAIAREADGGVVAVAELPRVGICLCVLEAGINVKVGSETCVTPGDEQAIVGVPGLGLRLPPEEDGLVAIHATRAAPPHEAAARPLESLVEVLLAQPHVGIALGIEHGPSVPMLV
mmetsp:Transcript_151972/g.369034  ORF Transcript_151972/g.369034 Transcript_151972/m.369034 type:complete len:300 (-) Transcript_151972:278-1177(-)